MQNKEESQKFKIMFETKGKKLLLTQLSLEAKLLQNNRGKSYKHS